MTARELSDRLWQFAARIAKVVDALPDTRVGRHVAGQNRPVSITNSKFSMTNSQSSSPKT
jgi:hypothetical protein